MSRPNDYGLPTRKSSNDVLVHWFFPFVIVAVVLTSVVLVATVGLAVFRRRRHVHRGLSCSSGTSVHQVSHPSSQILGEPSSPSPKMGFDAVTSSNASIHDFVGVHGGHFNGLECNAGVGVRHVASLDKNSYLRREPSSCEVTPMQQRQQPPTDINGCVITGSRNATLSRLRSQHDQLVVVERTCDSGLEHSSRPTDVTSILRRSSGGADLPLLKSITVGGRLAGGFEKNTGVGSKLSTLRGGRMRSPIVARDGVGNGGAGSAFSGSTGCEWSMNDGDLAVRVVR